MLPGRIDRISVSGGGCTLKMNLGLSEHLVAVFNNARRAEISVLKITACSGSAFYTELHAERFELLDHFRHDSNAPFSRCRLPEHADYNGHDLPPYHDF
jgi:hypothetical protein